MSLSLANVLIALVVLHSTSLGIGFTIGYNVGKQHKDKKRKKRCKQK